MFKVIPLRGVLGKIRLLGKRTAVPFLTSQRSSLGFMVTISVCPRLYRLATSNRV